MMIMIPPITEQVMMIRTSLLDRVDDFDVSVGETVTVKIAI